MHQARGATLKGYVAFLSRIGLAGVAAIAIFAWWANQVPAANFDEISGAGTVGSYAGQDGGTESVLVEQQPGFALPDSGGAGSALFDGHADVAFAEDEEHPGLLTSFNDFCRPRGRRCRDCGNLAASKPSGIVNRVLGDACPRWVVQADTLMLWQGNVMSRPLFTDTTSTLPVLNANQLYSPVAVGPRIGLFLNLDQVYSIEANYFSVVNFDATRTLPAGASQYTMDNLAGLTYADIDTATVNATAGIQSFELNWREWNCRSFTWLVGFRWVEWNETLTINDTYTDSVGISGTDSMVVGTGNNLYGAQIGGDALLWETSQLVRFNAVGKAGVYYNSAAFQRTDLNGDREFGNFATQADQTAFFGEVGVNGSLKLNKWLWWRAGYNFFWLSGVAIPSQQLSVTNQPNPPETSVNTTGSVLLHGVNTGIEARW